MRLPRLHIVTDARPGRDPLAAVRLALGAGNLAVQVRVKGLTDRSLYDLAGRVRSLCVELDGDCIIDDRLDVALAVGADGVHLGEDDLPLEAARRVVDEGFWLGGTARDPQTARRLEAEGATYLGVGPAYRTSTKEGLPEPLGPEGLAEVADAVRIPVIAIGGVTAARVPELMRAGAYGVAVVSAVSEAVDPHAATEGLLMALEGAR